MFNRMATGETVIHPAVARGLVPLALSCLTLKRNGYPSDRGSKPW
jgi:hypothetical protein